MLSNRKANSAPKIAAPRTNGFIPIFSDLYRQCGFLPVPFPINHPTMQHLVLRFRSARHLSTQTSPTFLPPWDARADTLRILTTDNRHWGRVQHWRWKVRWALPMGAPFHYGATPRMYTCCKSVCNIANLRKLEAKMKKTENLHHGMEHTMMMYRRLHKAPHHLHALCREVVSHLLKGKPICRRRPTRLQKLIFDHHSCLDRTFLTYTCTVVGTMWQLSFRSRLMGSRSR